MPKLSTGALGKLSRYHPASLVGRGQAKARMWGYGRAGGGLSTVSTPPTTTATPDSFITYIKRERKDSHPPNPQNLVGENGGAQLTRKYILHSCLFDV